MAEQAIPSAVNIDKPSLAHTAMQAVWALICDVLGGTRTIRAKGVAYLPKHAAESDTNYATRLAVATFTPFYRVATNSMVGRVFSREPLVTGADKDEQFEAWLENVDLAGNHFCVFFQNVFQALMNYGLTYLFCDYTKGRANATQEDEQKSGARPYLVHIPCYDVLGVVYDATGTNIIQARIREHTTKVDNYVETKVERIRVLEPNHYWLYELQTSQDGKETYILVEDGDMTLGVVPLVPLFAERESGVQSAPPLLEVAYLNIKYYQFESNHDNALTVAQFPMLAATGYSNDDMAIAVGPKKLLRAENADAKFYFVEHTGAAIEAGRKRLEDIQDAMALQGLKLLVPAVRSSAKTATEVDSDDEMTTSVLQMIAKRAADGMENALQLMAAWVGKTLELEVQLRGNYTLIASNPQELSTLLNAAVAGKLTAETLWAEFQRRGVLSDEFDAAVEAEKLASQTSDALTLEPDTGNTPNDNPPTE